ncbi:MAG: NADH-quinone oxidoreductase subunit K [Candidatus Omnitrophica bacterium]|nr:NADH-quinone oxidoreductase subunit K [Candidatus Omnitrophota bacterium]
MSGEITHIFWSFGLFIVMLFVIGLYCVLMTYNLVRALIGLEILIKGVTLLIIVAGYVSGHIALAQSLVITLIVIEVVVMTVAVGIVFGIRHYNESLDTRAIEKLKG